MPLWLSILLALAPYAVPPLLGLVYVGAKKAEQRLPANQRDLLDQVARVVVPAVEQQVSNSLNGPGKKEAAMQQAAVILQHLGISHVDPAVLSSFIEAAVKAQKLTEASQVLTTVPAPMSVVPTNEQH